MATKTDRAEAIQRVEAVQRGEGPPPRFRVYDIDATLYDAEGNVAAEWEDVQEVWLEPPTLVARRTRTLPDGSTVQYEDRGKLDQHLKIGGADGFGGDWGGRPFLQDGIIFTQGSGKKASFWMTSWTESPGEEHCLRVLDVHEPTAFLTEKPLEPGRYYVRTRDHLRVATDDVPDEMKQPLST